MSYFAFRPPKRGIDPLAEFRIICREEVAPSANAPINRITAVGAHYSRKGISANDGEWLRYAIRLSQDIGIPLSENFELTPLNLFNSKRQDFLKTGKSILADMLLICFVYNPPKHFRSRYINSDDLDLGISPHHFDNDAWHDAAQQTGARLIVPMAGSMEIDTSHFRGPEYVEVLPPRPINLGLRFSPFLVRRDLVDKLSFPQEWQVIAP